MCSTKIATRPAKHITLGNYDYDMLLCMGKHAHLIAALANQSMSVFASETSMPRMSIYPLDTESLEASGLQKPCPTEHPVPTFRSFRCRPGRTGLDFFRSFGLWFMSCHASQTGAARSELWREPRPSESVEVSCEP